MRIRVERGAHGFRGRARLPAARAPFGRRPRRIPPPSASKAAACEREMRPRLRNQNNNQAATGLYYCKVERVGERAGFTAVRAHLRRELRLGDGIDDPAAERAGWSRLGVRDATEIMSSEQGNDWPLRPSAEQQPLLTVRGRFC